MKYIDVYRMVKQGSLNKVAVSPFQVAGNWISNGINSAAQDIRNGLFDFRDTIMGQDRQDFLNIWRAPAEVRPQLQQMYREARGLGPKYNQAMDRAVAAANNRDYSKFKDLPGKDRKKLTQFREAVKDYSKLPKYNQQNSSTATRRQPPAVPPAKKSFPVPSAPKPPDPSTQQYNQKYKGITMTADQAIGMETARNKDAAGMMETKPGSGIWIPRNNPSNIAKPSIKASAIPQQQVASPTPQIKLTPIQRNKARFERWKKNNPSMYQSQLAPVKLA